jgi:fructose-bisphosphate aldolase class II
MLIRITEAQIERARIHTALMLDQAKTLDQIEAALDLGFSAVMIAAPLELLEGNIALTRKVVDLAYTKGLSVEEELGHVGMGLGVVEETRQEENLTHVDEAERFVKETGVDALAVSIGTLLGSTGKSYLNQKAS